MSSHSSPAPAASLDAPAWLCRIQTPNSDQREIPLWKFMIATMAINFVFIAAIVATAIHLGPARAGSLIIWLIAVFAMFMILSGVGTYLHVFVRRRQFCQSLQPPTPNDSYAQAAIRAWANQYRRFRKGRIDIDQWFNAVRHRMTIAPGEPPPIVIADAGITIPDLEVARQSISEQVDVGAARAITNREFRLRFIPLVIALPLLALAVMFNRGHNPFILYIQIPFLLWTAWMLLQRRGHVPGAVGVAIAEPGLVRVPRIRNELVFSTQDSVLVLSRNVIRNFKSSAGNYRGAGVPIIAVLHRVDGVRWWLGFTDCRDPGLADLLARWVAGYEAHTISRP
jgi:hypothetical protein